MCPDPGGCDTETLVNRIAHALRNPVFAASLQAELAAARSPDPAIGKVMEHLTRLDELINEMLLFGRPAQIQLREVQPVALLNEVAALMAADTEGTAPDIRVNGGVGPMTAFWDPHAVTLILKRLLKNAVENSPPPHTIMIDLTQSSDDGVEIAVIDHGSGINEELRDQIFLPFFPQHQGKAGLGLSVALKFAAALGGAIDLLPNPGGGTRAIVHLPLRAEP